MEGLGGAAPVAWAWGPVAIAAPAGFLEDVWAVLSNLAGHDEVDAPFAGLNQMSGGFWAAISEVMSIDGQHAVVLLQLAVSVGYPAIQHVEDEHPRFVHLAHQFYSQLLLGATFVENHMETVIPRSIGIQHLSIAPASELLLTQHSEPQHLTGLSQEVQGVVVGDIADVHSVDLEDDVSWQQPTISSDHSITINVLDNDMDQWGFAASHKPNGEAFIGIHSIDLDAGNFTIWNQVIQPWKNFRGSGIFGMVPALVGLIGNGTPTLCPSKNTQSPVNFFKRSTSDSGSFKGPCPSSIAPARV